MSEVTVESKNCTLKLFFVVVFHCTQDLELVVDDRLVHDEVDCNCVSLADLCFSVHFTQLQQEGNLAAPII